MSTAAASQVGSQEPTAARAAIRVLIVGGTGLIGSSISARLKAEGHWVAALSRSPGAKRPQHDRLIAADVAKLTSPEDWHAALQGIDAVVNCAGILQDSPQNSTAGVHRDGAAALFQACEALGIRRVIHLSAIGVDRATPTAYSKTKLEGDEALMARDLDWVILRPSVVIGRQAYGGSALFRGLAALPVLPQLPGTAPLQIVQLDDLVETILFFLRPEAPSRVALDIAGPERLGFTEIVRTYRNWLGWKPQIAFGVPSWLAALSYRLGDVAGLLGWRPPIRSTARDEIARGAVGDPSRWIELTGIVPQSLEASLAAEPASVQEKWFARLYFLKPLIIVIFALFWIGTGLIALGPGWDIGMGLMREGGIAEIGPLVVAAGALADIAIGIGILYRPTTRLALWAAFALSLIYVVIGTILVPRLWEDPLGPMLKIWPILVFNLVALAILEER